jgi:hypothetical protein
MQHLIKGVKKYYFCNVYFQIKGVKKYYFCNVYFQIKEELMLIPIQPCVTPVD